MSHCTVIARVRSGVPVGRQLEGWIGRWRPFRAA